MYDNIIKLIEVQHVLETKKNLISLSLFDFRGYSYSTNGWALKVCKGALLVIEGKLVNSLYHLKGSIIINLASISFMVDSNNGFTQLQHIRLGHMSERKMIELSKWDLLSN